MKIAGSGNIAGGDYNEEIAVAGSGKIVGNVKCEQLKSSGTLKSTGDVVCIEDLKSCGTLNVAGNVKGKRISTSGSAKIGGAVLADEDIKTSGCFFVDEDIKCAEFYADGSVKAGRGIEAEHVKISGSIVSDGLMNAEKIEMALEGLENKIISIGGSEIDIHPGKRASFVNKNVFFQKLVGGILGVLTVDECIEGDMITLEYVKAPEVIGRVVKIGPGCEIGTVKYTEDIEISTSAKVAANEKI